MYSKVLNRFDRVRETVRNFCKQRFLLYTMLLAAIVSIVYFICNIRLFSLKSPNFFSDFIDPIFTIFTLLTAILIGWYNIYLNWVNNIEKRLTVFFIYYFDSLDGLDKHIQEMPVKTPKNVEDREKKIKEFNFVKDQKLEEKTPYCLMICEESLLAHEGDIRNWAQQLGRQFEKDNLSFHPFFTLAKNDEIVAKISSNTSPKLITRQYCLFYFLDSIPQCIISSESGILSTDNYDDIPSSSLKKFQINKIDYKSLLTYEKYKAYIKTASEQKQEQTIQNQ